MARQGACGPMFWLGAHPGSLAVPAPLEGPIARELGAARYDGERLRDVVPAHRAMAHHVIKSDAVRYALIAEEIHQPIENHRRMAALDGHNDAAPRHIHAAAIDKDWGGCA